MRGKNYTSSEDDAIRDMVERGLPHKTIARRLNRPLLSIQKRVQRLGIRKPVKPPKKRSEIFYTERDIHRIMEAKRDLALYGRKGLQHVGGGLRRTGGRPEKEPCRGTKEGPNEWAKPINQPMETIMGDKTNLRRLNTLQKTAISKILKMAETDFAAMRWLMDKGLITMDADIEKMQAAMGEPGRRAELMRPCER